MTVELVLFGLWVAVSVMLVGSVAPVRGRRSLEWLLGKGPVSLENGRRTGNTWFSPEPDPEPRGMVRLERPVRGRSGFAAYQGLGLGENLDLPRSEASTVSLPRGGMVVQGFPTALVGGTRPLPRIPVLKKRTKSAHKKRPSNGETDTRDRLAVVG